MATNEQFSDQDYQEHVESYRSFLFGVRFSVIVAAIVLALMAYLLT